MTDWIGEILEKYGQHVSVQTADGVAATRAFLQPVTEKGEQVPETVTPIGWVDGRLWVYMGQVPVEEDDRIFWAEEEFRVRSSREYQLGESSLYWWAALERAKEAAQ